MIRKIFKYIKKPATVFLITGLIGLIIGLICGFQTNEMEKNFYEIGNISSFFEIFIKNASIISIIYISVAMTSKYAFFVYGLNGIVLGVTVGKILMSNVKLLLLLIPHGIFEIPCILATGYVVYKGESFIRTKFKKYVFTLFFHIIAIAFCAFVETFITPLFQHFL